jgi:hypothetical protein
MDEGVYRYGACRLLGAFGIRIKLSVLCMPPLSPKAKTRGKGKGKGKVYSTLNTAGVLLGSNIPVPFHVIMLELCSSFQ